MELINKLTSEKYQKVYKRRENRPVCIWAGHPGIFRLSSGLYELLGEPSHIEFFFEEGSLYVFAGDPHSGFKITITSKSSYATGSRLIYRRFFNSVPGKVVVFTEPRTFMIKGKSFQMYEIRIPENYAKAHR